MPYMYQVRVRGRLGGALLAEFGQLGLVADGDKVETQLHGEVSDQAALYGLVRRLEALGLELVELKQCPGSPEVPDELPRQG